MRDRPSAFFQDVICAPKGLMVNEAPEAVCVMFIGSFDIDDTNIIMDYEVAVEVTLVAVSFLW